MRKRTPSDKIITEDDFARLVDVHQHRLHVYLAGLTGQPEQAFDLVQETFYDAWQAACKAKPPFVPGADVTDIRRWLYRVATNNAISMLRRHRLIHWEPLDDHIELLPDERMPFEDHLAENDTLRAALARLGPQDVACLLLRVVHGFSAREVADILKTTSDNVDTRLARAKRRLRAAYEQRLTSQGEARTFP
ncbi:MAG TPA: sigma-70 family RNA polymerase sigma factor [Ktedonobacterales bacterium]|nr:sigma-70 family RNA polymerase sigma factor [Ktedonobacterales bacterium]